MCSCVVIKFLDEEVVQLSASFAEPSNGIIGDLNIFFRDRLPRRNAIQCNISLLLK